MELREEVCQLKDIVGFEANYINWPRKTEFPSDFQASDNQSGDILGQPFNWACRIRNINDFRMDCDQFMRKLYYMVLAIIGSIKSLFISHLTFKGQMSVSSSGATTETWFPRFIIFFCQKNKAAGGIGFLC